MTAPQLPPVQPDTSATSQILLKLGEMGTQLAVIHEQLKDLPDHEQRIRVLETGRNRLLGAAAAVSVAVSALGSWLGWLAARR